MNTKMQVAETCIFVILYISCVYSCLTGAHVVLDVCPRYCHCALISCTPSGNASGALYVACSV